MRSEQERSAAPADDFLLEETPETRGGERVEAARGLVEQEDGGVVEKSAGEAEAVGDARREGADLAVELVGDLHPGGDAGDAVANFRGGQIVHGGEESEIFASGEAGVEAFVAARVIAEPTARERAFFFRVVAANESAAAGGDDEGGKNSEQGGLSRAIGANDGHGFAAIDFK